MAVEFNIISEAEKIAAQAFTRAEKYHPRRVLRIIREQVPLPLVGTVAGLVLAPIMARIFSVPLDPVASFYIGGLTGWSIGMAADVYAGP